MAFPHLLYFRFEQLKSALEFVNFVVHLIIGTHASLVSPGW